MNYLFVEWIVVHLGASGHSKWRVFELEVVGAVRLANFIVAFTGYEANKLTGIQADRADEMHRLPIRHVIFELENDIPLRGLEKVVSGPLSFELVLAQQFTAQCLESLAKLNVRHVCHCQFGGKVVQELRSLGLVRRFATLEKPLDSSNGRRCLTGKPYSARGKPECFVDNRKVHSALQTCVRVESYPLRGAPRKGGPG